MKSLITALIDNIENNGFLYDDAEDEIQNYYESICDSIDKETLKIWKSDLLSLNDTDTNSIQEAINNQYERENCLGPILVNQAKNGNLEEVIRLIDKGCDVHWDDDEALSRSSLYGHIEVVRYLVEHGADIHANDDEALRCGAEKGHLNVIQFLVEKGADINANNEDALGWSSFYGHLDVVRYLVEHGAEMNNREALINSIEEGHLEIVRYLVEQGAEIHADEDDALISGAQYGQLEIVQYMVEHGADVHADKELCIVVAAEEGNLDIVKFLVEEGCNPKMAMKYGNEEVKDWAKQYINSTKLDAKLTNALNQKSTEKSKAQDLLTGIHSQGVKPNNRPAMRAKI